MSLRSFAIAYPVTAVIFLALDATWLSLAASRLYRPAMGELLLERFVVGPAIAFYALYMVGVVVFAVLPALPLRNWLGALGAGALLGLVAYATYDLTNQATLKGWSWQVTLADLCWGTFATGVSAALACAITGWISERIGR